MVEHDLAMVGVAGSNPVFRSRMKAHLSGLFLYHLLYHKNYFVFFVKSVAKKISFAIIIFVVAEVVQW